MSIFFEKFFKKKRSKRLYPKKVKLGNTPTRKKIYSKSIKKENSFSFSTPIFSSIIIFAGFISLSFTILFLSNQLQPLIKNEKLKFLCTYQLGDKKSQKYKDAKLKLEKITGDGDKFCKNFLIPKGKNNKRFRIFPIINNILFRFI